MNIYLHVEISSRELDSKLLLATLAASRGHQVIVSDLFGIERGIKIPFSSLEYFIPNPCQHIRIKFLDIRE